jgi:hypothetical protein
MITTYYSKMSVRERREAMIEYLNELIVSTKDKEMREELIFTRDQLSASLSKLEESL